MSVLRISDSLAFSGLTQQLMQLQVQIRDVEDQITSGQRVNSPDDDPVGAAQIVRLDGNLDALGQYDQSTSFGKDVLTSQDDALGQANDLLTRAQEIATEMSSGAVTQDQRNAAAEEVHGLLQQLTALGNTNLAGRYVFASLAPTDASPTPFDDPDQAGYDPTAYHGSTQPFSITVGAGVGQTVRLTTSGNQVFTSGLVALNTLETTLRAGGTPTASLDALEQARGTVDAERASVGARETILNGRSDQIAAQTVEQKGTRSRIADTDLTKAITQLTQLQTALQAALAAGGQIAQMGLIQL